MNNPDTQVLGRALTAGGFMGPTVLGLQRLELTCGLNTWRYYLVIDLQYFALYTCA